MGIPLRVIMVVKVGARFVGANIVTPDWIGGEGFSFYQSPQYPASCGRLAFQ